MALHPSPLQVPSHFLEWIDQASELYWSIDQNGKYTYLNLAWEALLGYPTHEMLGQPFFDFQPAHESALNQQRLADLAQNPNALRLETVLVRKDGTLVKVFFSCKPILEGKELRGFFGMGFDLTAIRANEARLEMSQSQLESFITLAPTAIAIFDTDLRYLAYSERWLEDYGLQGEALKGRHHYDVFPSIRENQEWKRIHQLSLAGETIQKEEDTFIGADGRQEWLRWVVRPWYSQPGIIGGILMLTESITARRRAEIELRDSEERYRQLFDLGFESIFIHENDIIIACNQATVHLLGYNSKDEILGLRGAEFIVAPESRSEVLRRIQKHDTAPIEIWCRRKDGSRIMIETQAREIVFQNRPMRLVAVRDVTDIRQHQDALAAEKERLRVTLHSIGDGVIATDTQGCVRMMNTVAEQLTGYSQAEAEGLPLNKVFQIIHEYTRKPCENPVDKVLASGEVIELANHTLLLARDGAERVIADSGAPIRDAQNKIIGVVLVFRDTTEKQKLISAAERSQKLESLGILAGGIAHDFNNLLGGIFGYVDLAHAKTRDSQVTSPLEKALATIDRARGLTQQLLTFAKGGAPIRKVAWLFPFVEDTVRFIMSGSSVGCRFEIATELPASYFDRNQIGQVIDNLTINAQQAMPLGGIFTVKAKTTHLLHNQVEGLPESAYLHLSFSDTGIGIPPEILPRIFDPFFTTKQKGSGLGLATSYSILKQHDGGIEVRSDPGKGTTFHIYLPVSQERPRVEESLATTLNQGQGLILLMDDEPVIRETIGQMLADQGFTVKGFAEGQSLLDFVSDGKSNQAPAAILLDLTVPGGKGGRDIAAELRQRFPNTPIVVSSGYADDPIMADPSRYGITASLSKPFRRRELIALLQKWIT